MIKVSILSLQQAPSLSLSLSLASQLQVNQMKPLPSLLPGEERALVAKAPL